MKTSIEQQIATALNERVEDVKIRKSYDGIVWFWVCDLDCSARLLKNGNLKKNSCRRDFD